MGRAKVDTTLNVDTQVIDGAMRSAVDKVGSQLFTIVHNPEKGEELPRRPDSGTASARQVHLTRSPDDRSRRRVWSRNGWVSRHSTASRHTPGRSADAPSSLRFHALLALASFAMFHSNDCADMSARLSRHKAVVRQNHAA
jgi:hypothetical protein